jgi:hypothetical protein
MKRDSSKRKPSPRETLLSWGIILVLGVIAVGVYLKQSRYEPGIWVPEETAWISENDSPSETAGPPDFESLLPPTLTPMGPLESFGPDTLSQKIDGKAELYLPAGFEHLWCRRFKSASGSEDWMEAFLYDMGNIRNAFAVFSAQRRSAATELRLTRFSYETQNALFFVHGRYYVELIASSASEGIMDAAEAFAVQFVNQFSPGDTRIEALDLFPERGLDTRNMGLIISDAFGFKGLQNVFTARYQLDSHELTAFLTEKADTEEAEALVADYRDFLVENGGKVESVAPFPGAVMVGLFGTFEIFFPCGPYVVGVHQAEARNPAEDLVLRLREHLGVACK